MGYFLKKTDKDFLLLDGSNRVGDSWRNRYDSLVLFTPRSHSYLPGMKLLGNQNEYPTKDEIADYLEAYSIKFDIPIHLGSYVKEISKMDEIFCISTNSGFVYHSKNVIIASGPFQKPFYPSFAKDIPSGITQIHADNYRNSSQLNKGNVVVVGGGNSGMQIAAELCLEREVYLSIGKKQRYFPYKILDKSIFWWLGILGISKVTINSKLGKIIKKNDPIIGTEYRALIKSRKVKLLPRAKEFKRNKLVFDKIEIQPRNIIWATGYSPSYKWINFTHIFDKDGLPKHKRGVTTELGLYFLGLSWQYRRGSALLLGVADDARYLLSELESN